jgi:hypothetical protein
MQATMNQTRTSPSPMRHFDPAKVARYEAQCWVVYYQKNWPALLRNLLGLIQSTFGLSLLQAMRAALFATRAQVAFAPFPDNNVPKAIASQREFYALIQRVNAKYGESFDPGTVAKLDVDWWVIHRERFGQTDNAPLAAAVAELYAATYHMPAAGVLEAAQLRADAMIYSDRWVKESRDPQHPLVPQIEATLLKSYQALRMSIDA